MVNVERIKVDEMSGIVNRIFNECLCTSESEVTANPSNYGTIEDLRTEEVVYYLEKDKLEKNKGIIQRLLDELSDVFKESGGGGYTFLALCKNKDGEQWTGLHEVMAKLVYLGLAIGVTEYCLPRSLWHVLPGRMPYVMIKDSLFTWRDPLKTE